ncbi:hypothetical protein CMI41_01515 [Candidatus Pacearchaeota archaeon]|jgi:hypothetical protein|nr:hypothetical protein [Candidatus Pacearchaeota archaeon]|tara:strand:+ start:782 stop:1138 length:357 start_codon:yes stop_codon:yes gene_type:complete
MATLGKALQDLSYSSGWFYNAKDGAYRPDHWVCSLETDNHPIRDWMYRVANSILPEKLQLKHTFDEGTIFYTIPGGGSGGGKVKNLKNDRPATPADYKESREKHERAFLRTYAKPFVT